ncbi:MAG: hypothetical protein Q8930_10375 [Bacillota bacterium]|nr:hypothetical protein [Bacillota bacterium]
MRKRYWFALGVIVLLYFIFVRYNKAYSISGDNPEIQKQILGLINESKTVTDSLDIKQIMNMDSKRYVLYTFNTFIGETEMERGMNNRYKITYTSYDIAMLKYRVQTTNHGNYFVIDGKNPDKLIASAKVTIDNKVYSVKIPEQEYFIACCSVSKDVQNRFPAKDSLVLFDKSDKDITADIYKKYQDSLPK